MGQPAEPPPAPASGWHAEVLRTAGQADSEPTPPVVYGRASVRQPPPAQPPPAPPATATPFAAPPVPTAPAIAGQRFWSTAAHPANQHLANQYSANQHLANQHLANENPANQHPAGTPVDEPAALDSLERLAGRARRGDTPRRRLRGTLSRAMGGGSGEVHALT
ncbi:MAG TPA: hypothetical protein VGJ07_04520, partial [Rugosimonospora sp.]